MYNFKYLLGLLFLVISFTTNSASSYRKIVYNAYIYQNMDAWASVINSFEKSNPTTLVKKLELTNYYYGYIAYLIGNKKGETAEKYLVKADLLVEEIIKIWPNNATAIAYKGSLIGLRVGINHFKAILLGPKSKYYLNKAEELESSNLQVLIDKGNFLFHTPKLMGGDKNEALKLFLKGIKIIELSNDTNDNWFYLNTMTLAARAYGYLKQNENAKRMYKKILYIEPEFKWVKDDLYPSLLKNMK